MHATERIISEASELVHAMIREEHVNPCEWCGTPTDKESSGDCDTCCVYTEDSHGCCLFRLAVPEITGSLPGDKAILDAMTEHNFHTLRATCDKYMIRGKLLSLLSDHCGVPTRL